MRVVAVYSDNPKNVFPQNAIFAKKLGHKYRKPTKEELKGWGLDKRKSFVQLIKECASVTQEDLKRQSLIERLYDPDINMTEYKYLRNKLYPQQKV